MRIVRLAAFALLVFAAVPALAQTTINFEGIGVFNAIVIPGNYQDHAPGTSNIGVAYHTIGHPTLPNNILGWTTAYGDLVNVGYAADSTSAAEIVFTPDPGFELILTSFDMAGWPTVDRPIDLLRVTDGGGTPFPGLDFAANAGGTVVIEGNNGHSHFDVNLASSGVVRLQWGHDFNVGIDNVLFSQRLIGAAVPEPGALAFLAGPVLLAGYGLRRRLRKA